MITPLVAGRGRPFQQELVAALRRAGFELDEDDLTELDLDDAYACRQVLTRSRADIVIDCSGADDVGPGDPRPTPEELSASASLAVAAAEHGVHTVLISSASVFGGDTRGPRVESDPPSPDTAPAAALATVERAAARANPDHTIVRSSRLYGLMWNSPLDEVIRRAQANDPVVVEPRTIAPPTYAPHLASLLVSLVRKPCHGIIHRAAPGACDELELTRAVLSLAGLSRHIEPTGKPVPNRVAPVLLASCRDELPAIPHWRIGLRTCALERDRMLAQDGNRRARRG